MLETPEARKNREQIIKNHEQLGFNHAFCPICYNKGKRDAKDKKR